MSEGSHSAGMIIHTTHVVIVDFRQSSGGGVRGGGGLEAGFESVHVELGRNGFYICLKRSQNMSSQWKLVPLYIYILYTLGLLLLLLYIYYIP